MEQTNARTQGSETRQRQQMIGFRVNPQEHAEIEAAADRVGLTVASYVRAKTLVSPSTRSRRKPSIEHTTLAQLLGAVNRVGSNINQLAKGMNLGDTPLGDELREALESSRQVGSAIKRRLLER